jgi:hypothetical protein
MAPATRAALHGTVTAFVVTLRVLAAVAEVTADVLRRIADLIAAGRNAPKSGNTSTTAQGAAQGSLIP